MNDTRRSILLRVLAFLAALFLLNLVLSQFLLRREVTWRRIYQTPSMLVSGEAYRSFSSVLGNGAHSGYDNANLPVVDVDVEFAGAGSATGTGSTSATATPGEAAMTTFLGPAGNGNGDEASSSPIDRTSDKPVAKARLRKRR